MDRLNEWTDERMELELLTECLGGDSLLGLQEVSIDVLPSQDSSSSSSPSSSSSSPSSFKMWKDGATIHSAPVVMPSFESSQSLASSSSSSSSPSSSTLLLSSTSSCQALDSVPSPSTSRNSRHHALRDEGVMDELSSLCTKDFNRALRRAPQEEKEELKRRRRKVKNRGYARTCRSRKVGRQTELKQEVVLLWEEMKRVMEENSVLKNELDRLRRLVGHDM